MHRARGATRLKTRGPARGRRCTGSPPRSAARGAQRTNEIKRERAAKRREAGGEPLDLAERLYLLKADKMLLLQTFNRLSRELSCSDCRCGLVAVELVLKYLVRPRLPKDPGLGAAAITITERIRESAPHRPVRLSGPAARPLIRTRSATTEP